MEAFEIGEINSMSKIQFFELIREVKDFPQKGILFRDVSPLLKNPKALQHICDCFAENHDLSKIEYFAGIESRGFIFASLLAAKFDKGIVLLRKAGKLPPPVLQESYKLEYGSATLEIAQGSGAIFIVDDVLATGGTLEAAIRLCKKAGYEVTEVGVLINLTSLNKVKFKGNEIFSVYQYE